MVPPVIDDTTSLLNLEIQSHGHHFAASDVSSVYFRDADITEHAVKINWLSICIPADQWETPTRQCCFCWKRSQPWNFPLSVLQCWLVTSPRIGFPVWRQAIWWNQIGTLKTSNLMKVTDRYLAVPGDWPSWSRALHQRVSPTAVQLECVELGQQVSCPSLAVELQSLAMIHKWYTHDVPFTYPPSRDDFTNISPVNWW